ncbi:MAG: hypothetical protein AAGB35_02915 [Pseudomonadota bacterium]
MRIFTFRNFRILFLLAILGVVAFSAKNQQLVTQGWYKPLDIVVYPINPNNSLIVQQYIDSLNNYSFQEIDKFVSRESKKYNIITSRPTRTRLGQTLTELPPTAPPPGSNILTNAFWSLKLRFWIWQHAPDEADDDFLVRMFVLYHDPKKFGKLEHSVGLQKGLVGIVNAYGVKSQASQNNMVIVHEFFHTVGASDKYGANGHPVIPNGLGDPNKSPRYPQSKAEIMAGRKAISANTSKMPTSFKEMIVGEKTAQEIGWLNPL